MTDLTQEQIVANEKVAADKVIADKQATELKTQSKAEALRELSKELGINAFEPKEIKTKFDEFTKWQESQKSEQDILQGKVDALTLKETEWETSKLNYESKLKASELGIPQDKLDDALKLAGGDVNKLDEVIKKYPMFKSTEGIHLGIQQPNGFETPSGNTEQKIYMAQNPHIYGK